MLCLESTVFDSPKFLMCKSEFSTQKCSRMAHSTNSCERLSTNIKLDSFDDFLFSVKIEEVHYPFLVYSGRENAGLDRTLSTRLAGPWQPMLNNNLQGRSIVSIRQKYWMCSPNLPSRCQNLQNWTMQQRSNHSRSPDLLVYSKSFEEAV